MPRPSPILTPLLAPFIRYDGLTYEEVKQALQEFIFNINVPTRVGFQTPFTNITMDLVVPSYYTNQGLCAAERSKKKPMANSKKNWICSIRPF